MIQAKSAWTEVFKVQDAPVVRVEREDDGTVKLIIERPEDHYYVEVGLVPDAAQAVAHELMLAASLR
jgi:hypothetical protein